eukprot:COSAG05_NODE_14914_length_383_cov_0.957746_1_plen_54_part_01
MSATLAAAKAASSVAGATATDRVAFRHQRGLSRQCERYVAAFSVVDIAQDIAMV